MKVTRYGPALLGVVTILLSLIQPSECGIRGGPAEQQDEDFKDMWLRFSSEVHEKQDALSEEDWEMQDGIEGEDSEFWHRELAASVPTNSGIFQLCTDPSGPLNSGITASECGALLAAFNLVSPEQFGPFFGFSFIGGQVVRTNTAPQFNLETANDECIADGCRPKQGDDDYVNCLISRANNIDYACAGGRQGEVPVPISNPTPAPAPTPTFPTTTPTFPTTTPTFPTTTPTFPTPFPTPSPTPAKKKRAKAKARTARKKRGRARKARRGRRAKRARRKRRGRSARGRTAGRSAQRTTTKKTKKKKKKSKKF